MSSLLVRQAQPAEWPLVNEWLPRSFVGLEEAPLCVFVAATPEGHVLGAATVRAMRDRSGQPEGRFLIWVRPEFRRRGIGTALMTEVYRLAEAARFVRVAAVDVVSEQEEFVPFFPRVGLRPQMTLTTFQFLAETFRRRLEPRYEFQSANTPRVRLDEVRSIYDLPPRAVAEFAVGEGGLVSWYESRLLERHYCPHTSVGISLDGRIIAALLTRSQPYVEPVGISTDGSLLVSPNVTPSQFTMFVELMRVAPEFQSGSALTALLMASVTRGMANGGIAFAFESDEHLHPTMFHWGRRWQGAVLGRRLLFANEREAWRLQIAPAELCPDDTHNRPNGSRKTTRKMW